MSPGVVETEFVERMIGKDQGGEVQAKQFYSSFKAIQAQDVADTVLHIISAPKHVQVPITNLRLLYRDISYEMK